MAHGRDSVAPLQRARDSLQATLPDFLTERERVVLAVGSVTLFALLARLVFLGVRPAHWDEGRVAYWALRYEETGAFAYQYIIHGPFIHHATQPLFSLFGYSDFLTRLPVALVGGLAPLSALLYRKHLRESETVVLALILASNAAVLYYGRFMRSDVLVATFMFTAFGFVVRYYDTRRFRYLYAAGAFAMLGVASKENAILYLLTWGGATALLLDIGLFRPRNADNGLTLLARKARALKDAATTDQGTLDTGRVFSVVVNYAFHAVGIALLVGGVWLFMFAPRGNAVDIYPPVTSEMVSLWAGITDPTQFPAMVLDTADYFYNQYLSWFGTSSPGQGEGWVEKYEHFAPQYFDLLFNYAGPVVLFSLVGFVRERYGSSERRNLVLFFGYAGFVSALAYPLAMDIFGPWNAVHAVVPLAIPAAVGIGIIYRWGRDALTETDYVSTGLAALVLVIVVGQVAVTAAGAVYLHPESDENTLVQYGQPAGDLRATLSEMEGVVADNSGTDVLIYGDSFIGETDSEYYKPYCMGNSGWFDGLPLPWYLNAHGASVECTEDTEDLAAAMEGDRPPVIITKPDELSNIENRIAEYEVNIHRIRTVGSETAFLIDRDAVTE